MSKVTRLLGLAVAVEAALWVTMAGVLYLIWNGLGFVHALSPTNVATVSTFFMFIPIMLLVAYSKPVE